MKQIIPNGLLIFLSLRNTDSIPLMLRYFQSVWLVKESLAKRVSLINRKLVFCDLKYLQYYTYAVRNIIQHSILDD